MNSLKTIRVSDSHYRIMDTDGRGYVCMDLITGTKKALLIDTGYGGKALVQTLNELRGMRLYPQPLPQPGPPGDLPPGVWHALCF